MTDPSNSRDDETDAREPTTDSVEHDSFEVADDGAADEDSLAHEAAGDELADTDEPDDSDDEAPTVSSSEAGVARDRPKPSGKASRSGNPARAAAAEGKSRRTRPVKPQRIGNRWAAPAMLTSAAIGLIWIVLYYVFANGDNPIPVMGDLGDWNLIIGMGFIVAAFGFSMKWE